MLQRVYPPTVYRSVTNRTKHLSTTVKTVKGRVWHVNPPHTVILVLEDGSSQRFEIPEGQRFKVEGQTVDAWGLKTGDDSYRYHSRRVYGHEVE